MTLTELYDMAEKEKIDIQSIRFKDLDGLFIEDNIYLNKRVLNTEKEKETLCEELAHYFVGVSPTPPFNQDYYDLLIRSKNEFKAKKWIVNKLVPLSRLKPFFDTDLSNYEVAEELGVSASLIEEAFKIYKLEEIQCQEVMKNEMISID